MKPEDVARYSSRLWDPAAEPGLREEVARYPFLVRGMRVLDLAAGPGAFTAALLRAGASSVVWQDRDPAFLEIARQRLAPDHRVSFELRDMLDLPYPPESFDLVAMRDALHWAADEALLLRRLAPLVRPGGWLVVTNHNFRRVWAIRPWWRAAAHLASPWAALLLGRKLAPTLWVFEGLTRRRIRRAGMGLLEWRQLDGHDFMAVGRRDAHEPGRGRRPGS